MNFASTAGEYGSISPARALRGGEGRRDRDDEVARPRGEPARRPRQRDLARADRHGRARRRDRRSRRRAAGARTLFNRLGRPDEIAASCVYLVSDMSSFVTGHGAPGQRRLAALGATLVEAHRGALAEGDLRHAPVRAHVDAQLPVRGSCATEEVVAAAVDVPVRPGAEPGVGA